MYVCMHVEHATSLFDETDRQGIPERKSVGLIDKAAQSMCVVFTSMYMASKIQCICTEIRQVFDA